MSRNYQHYHMARDEAAAADDKAERAEMRARGISTIDRSRPEDASVTCDGCFQSFHPDAVDGNEDGWACTECDTWHDKD